MNGFVLSLLQGNIPMTLCRAAYFYSKVENGCLKELGSATIIDT